MHGRQIELIYRIKLISCRDRLPRRSCSALNSNILFNSMSVRFLYYAKLDYSVSSLHGNRSKYNLFRFYRATHMHSADYGKMSVCPSVCPSVFCLNGYKYPHSVFIIGYLVLIFPYQTGWQYSDGTPPPPNGGAECKRGMKKHDIRRISRFTSEMMQDRAIVTMEGE